MNRLEYFQKREYKNHKLNKKLDASSNRRTKFSLHGLLSKFVAQQENLGIYGKLPVPSYRLSFWNLSRNLYYTEDYLFRQYCI